MPGGSERRGREAWSEVLLGAEPWARGSVDGGAGGGGGSPALMTPGLKEGECGGPGLCGASGLREVGRGQATRILV